MLTLFKGELSYHEFMYEMTYKDMMTLRDCRVEQLLEEKKRTEKEMEDRKRESTKNMILAK